MMNQVNQSMPASGNPTKYFYLLLKLIALIIVLPGILLPVLFIILFPFNWIL